MVIGWIHSFDSQVGFWTNQIIFEGFKFPLNTVNPLLEVTTNYDATGVDFKSNFTTAIGLEWRPLQRNPWLYNYRPWGLPLLEWIRNYRFFVAYGNQMNNKDEFGGAKHDLTAGVQIFYEFGVDLQPLDEPAPDSMPEYLRRYVWGEYFGDYRYRSTASAK